MGLRHSGPRPVVALGTLIIALGPAFCVPLNGVVPVNPHGAASAGLLNQNPTWKVCVGSSGGVVPASKPKIWLTKIDRITVKAFPKLSARMSD